MAYGEAQFGTFIIFGRPICRMDEVPFQTQSQLFCNRPRLGAYLAKKKKKKKNAHILFQIGCFVFCLFFLVLVVMGHKITLFRGIEIYPAYRLERVEIIF